MTEMVNRPRAAQQSEQTDWLVCRRCQGLLYRKRFDRFAGVCPECGWHSPMTAAERLAKLLDDGSAKPVEPRPAVHDPLTFTDLVPYATRLAKARSATGLDDAVQVAHGAVHGHSVVVVAMDFRFLGGSLGSAAGEAIATAAEAAIAHDSPLLLVTASGGARMQEGVLSLMQMAKTSNAMAELDEAGLLTITLVTDPTFGGVAASYATLSDIIVAEPGARMGFAGRRVIEQTIGQRLPEGFQTAEFLLSHGHVDDVRPRPELPRMLANLLSMTRPAGTGWGHSVTDPVLRDPGLLPEKPVDEVLRTARELARPTTLDHIDNWADGFVELHGDRRGSDCPAIVGGLGSLDGLPVMFIGHQKGHSTAELVKRQFGMPSPSGYRKAERLMRLAAKLRVPVVALVDTPGAHPGLEAEEQGQAAAIAECLRTMGGLPVPVVSVITGEGGSGGALALAVADRVLVSENGIYSVISPEGCAAILWRDPGAATRAAGALRVDAGSLLRLGIVDGVVPEPDGGAHRNPDAASDLVRRSVVAALRELRARPGNELVAARRARFRAFGLAGA
ncbi:acetyl-CoA carboxylase, carboxyltransferase subunit beta [Amycolatopsis nigrescens]|uniref:acetyl-CoA carboxylase, carboxyltransferase subunit beta n=1 Tax=Amycolatopsis nigrescens TaxID=381445 RepID=UPI00035D4989|nr:acetyl-CoA carboxylase, carboxyltransferase subunit beta [Amycolatopsis nigrescens]